MRNSTITHSSMRSLASLWPMAAKRSAARIGNNGNCHAMPLPERSERGILPQFGLAENDRARGREREVHLVVVHDLPSLPAARPRCSGRSALSLSGTETRGVLRGGA